MPRPTQHPRTTPPERVPQDARRLFGAVLEGWAADVLRLRARGLDRPSRRDGAGGPILGTRCTRPDPVCPDADTPRPAWAA